MGVAAPGVNFSTPRSRCPGPRGEAEIKCGQVAPCGGGVGGRTSSPDGGLGGTPEGWVLQRLNPESIAPKHSSLKFIRFTDRPKVAIYPATVREIWSTEFT
jgi:hypothetical protein